MESCRPSIVRLAIAFAALCSCAKVNQGGGKAADAGSSDLPLDGARLDLRPVDVPSVEVPPVDVPASEKFVAEAGMGGTSPPSDPVTCEEAEKNRTYVGCDYWPTVVANNVWSIFDFAVVVANGQAVAADITITGPAGLHQTTTVAPGAIGKMYLPWVKDLKGPDTDECGNAIALTASVLSRSGAYHLVSSVPVSVYQFNPLEYRPAGGPPGKDWSQCPGRRLCQSASTAVGCLSYQNDASFLLPSTAMTGNYRITGVPGWSGNDIIGGPYDIQGAYFAVTATADDTKVKIQMSATAQVLAGGAAIPAVAPGQILSLTLQQGDVAEIVSPIGRRFDFSGSVVNADKPVQVITGIPCLKVPENTEACDHVEESVLPAETLGKHYLVAVPTSAAGMTVGHVVRFVGNVDGTTLTYAPKKPDACPASLKAGQVVDCGVVADDFEVTGDHEFGVTMFQLSAFAAEPYKPFADRKGDPSQTVAVAVEQYRLKYIFLAPDDYEVNYVDITGPVGTAVTLDGAAVTAPFTPIGATGYGVARVKLLGGQAGAHAMTSDQPVGIQVLGYGDATSYQYPGGLNLQMIAPPIIIY